jgi:hypothetical protein
MRKRSASSILVVVAAVLLMASPAWPNPNTSELTDPVGDLNIFEPGRIPEPLVDITLASITKRGGIFLLGMTVAQEIPDNPPLDPSINKITWGWVFETDLSSGPIGYPFPPSDPAGFEFPTEGTEFIVWVVWDGAFLEGHVIDRRPLLAGEQAIVTPVPFKIKGADITMVVDESLLGDPSDFRWAGFTEIWSSEIFGSNAFSNIDSTGGSTWPPQ